MTLCCTRIPCGQEFLRADTMAQHFANLLADLIPLRPRGHRLLTDPRSKRAAPSRRTMYETKAGKAHHAVNNCMEHSLCVVFKIAYPFWRLTLFGHCAQFSRFSKCCAPLRVRAAFHISSVQSCATQLRSFALLCCQSASSPPVCTAALPVSTKMCW